MWHGHQVDAIQASMNVLGCMLVQQIQQATVQDEHLQQLKGFIIAGWQENKEQVHQDIRAYWSFRDDMAVVDGVIMKGRCIGIPEALKPQALDQLHINPMDIEKTKLLVHKSIYWAHINNNIQPVLAITQTMHHKVTTCHLIMQQHLKDRTIVKEISRQISIINKIPINRSSENKEDGQGTVIQTRYGRVIRKPDRLVY